MEQSFDKIAHEALSLSVQERGILATRLLESMDSAGNNPVLDSWLDVADRRLKDIDEGRVIPISEEEVEHRIRARLA